MTDDRSIASQTEKDGPESKPVIERPPKNTIASQPEVGINPFQAVTLVLGFVATATVFFLGGILYERQQGIAYSQDFEIFWEAWEYIDEEYYQEPPPVSERVYGGIDGVLRALGDEYSSVSPPVQAEQHREEIEGKFGGIGAYVDINDDEEPYIVDIVADECIATTPAERAGLQANDVIRAVDGQEVKGWAIEDVIDIVKGKSGTDVTLTIYRPEDDEAFDVTIERDEVEQITVVDRDFENVGYVHLRVFNSIAAEQMKCKLESIIADNPQAIIFDLRGNGGGLLDEAIDVADLFLDNGVVVSQRDRDGKEEERFSDSGDLAEGIPLVVLIDGGSASASEVVAGALQDRGQAVLIGQTSFGKGSVQNVHVLADGGELRITSAAWYTPDGRRIHGIGLEPDIFVDLAQTTEDNPDPVLDRALEYIAEHYSPATDAAASSPEASSEAEAVTARIG
ncbi:MAG: S41 family peptidase [Chloroflexi bacterium]|nr:S41 family peptidase [Chloroflexota bacterium]